MPRRPLPLPELVLILVTIVWGGTFLIVQRALAETGPLFFVGLRFGAATLLLLLFSARGSEGTLRGMRPIDLTAGIAIGGFIALGYALQTYGLQSIPSSKSAFITAFYVPVVPLLQWVVMKEPPGKWGWIGVAFAFGGLVLLAGPEGASLTMGRGEFLTFLSAIAFAAEILLIGFFAGKADLRRVTLLQLATGSLLAFLAMPLFGEAIPPLTLLVLGSAVGLGVASTAIQLAMNWAQRTVSPTRATLIYAGEPVWAGIFGRLAGERLGAAGWIGGALVVLGAIVGAGRREPEDAQRGREGGQ